MREIYCCQRTTRSRNFELKSNSFNIYIDDDLYAMCRFRRHELLKKKTTNQNPPEKKQQKKTKTTHKTKTEDFKLAHRKGYVL